LNLDAAREQLLPKVQDIFSDRSDSNHEVTILAGVTPDDFAWLKKQGEDGEIPEWENRRWI
jgi:hypothetical protein